ncbi:hypothetical protein V6N13_106419 [Hibiscus sabdariffa]
MASSAVVEVLKHGNCEGSPLSRGMMGLGSSVLRFLINLWIIPRKLIADVEFSLLFPCKRHLCEPFSIFLFVTASS